MKPMKKTAKKMAVKKIAKKSAAKAPMADLAGSTNKPPKGASPMPNPTAPGGPDIQGMVDSIFKGR